MSQSNKVQFYKEQGLQIVGMLPGFQSDEEQPLLGLFEEDLYEVNTVLMVGISETGGAETDAVLIVRTQDRALITNESLTQLLEEILPSQQHFLDLIDNDLDPEEVAKCASITIHNITNWKGELVWHSAEQSERE